MGMVKEQFLIDTVTMLIAQTNLLTQQVELLQELQQGNIQAQLSIAKILNNQNTVLEKIIDEN